MHLLIVHFGTYLEAPQLAPVTLLFAFVMVELLLWIDVILSGQPAAVPVEEENPW